jgi:hypothetical protein
MAKTVDSGFFTNASGGANVSNTQLAGSGSLTTNSIDFRGCYGGVVDVRVYNHNGSANTNPNDATPATWYLEGSVDDSTWYVVHEAIGSIADGGNVTWGDIEVGLNTHYIRLRFVGADVITSLWAQYGRTLTI